MQDILQEMNTNWNKIVEYFEALPEPVKIIIMLLLYVFLMIFTLRVARGLINRNSKKLTANTHATLLTLSRMVIMLLFGVAFLNQFESFAGSLIGISALLGTAIGFASTQTVGNMISGLYIMVSRPFYIADYVIFPKLGMQGIVKEITLNYTKVIMPNGTNAIISNRTVLGTEVVNTRVEVDTENNKPSKNKKTDEDESIDMANVKREFSKLFKKITTSKKTIYYIYPLTFGVDVNLKQSNVNKAVTNLEVYLQQIDSVKDTHWNVISRNRLEVTYELAIVVDSPYAIFRIVSDAYNQLEVLLEGIQPIKQ